MPITNYENLKYFAFAHKTYLFNFQFDFTMIFWVNFRVCLRYKLIINYYFLISILQIYISGLDVSKSSKLSNTLISVLF